MGVFLEAMVAMLPAYKRKLQQRREALSMPPYGKRHNQPKPGQSKRKNKAQRAARKATRRNGKG